MSDRLFFRYFIVRMMAMNHQMMTWIAFRIHSMINCVERGNYIIVSLIKNVVLDLFALVLKTMISEHNSEEERSLNSKECPKILK
jgi:hypothetical protein